MSKTEKQYQVANLLMQYNKDNKQRQEIIEARADKQTKFGTWSYANPYDALYEKFHSDKNFDVRMWQEALQLGEQDQYLSFIAANQGTDLGDKFYDANYYDYETRMLELYKKMADTTNTEERFIDVYDEASDSFVKQSLGKMSDYDYINYQLGKAYAIRDEEMTRALEKWRKDNLNWAEKGANFLKSLTYEFGEGLMQGVAGIWDAMVAIGSFGLIPYAAQGFKGDYLDAFVNYFGEKGLTALERKNIRAELDEWERKNSVMRDIDGNMTNWGIYAAGVANSIGAMLPSILINVAVPGGGLLANMAFGAQIFSSNMYENANNALIAESPASVKILNATVKTVIEQVIEVGLDKFLGGTAQNVMKGLGKGAAGITAKTAFGVGAKYFAKSALQEGFEEFLQDGFTALADTFFGLVWEGYGEHGVTWETLWQSFACGTLSSMIMTSGQAAHIRVNKSVKQRQANKYQTSTKYKEKYDNRYTKRYEKENGAKPDTIVGPEAPADYLVKNRKGEFKKMGAFAEIAFTDMFNQLNNDIKKLSEGKFSTKKNLNLAKSVYNTLSNFAAFFQGIDNDTLKSMTLLFDRMEKSANVEIAPSTNTNIQKAKIRADVAVKARTFAAQAAIDFSNMLEKNTKTATKAIEAAKKVDNTLTAADVTEVRATVDKDGNLTGEIAAVDEALKGKIKDNYDELRKQYDWVFITDGHSAVAVNNMLFVSEAWLQNYQASDIYGFLSQNNIIEKIVNNKELSALIDEVVKFDEQFTKKENITREQAVMDLLFNKSVYQAFLLSSIDGSPNAVRHKNILFRLPQMITFLAKKGGTQLENNYLQKTVNMIKDTMREPMMKAVINWNMDPQAIGADFVFTEADKQFINAYKSRQQTFTDVASGDIEKAQRLSPQFINDTQLTDDIKIAIQTGLRKTATPIQRAQAALLMQLAADNASFNARDLTANLDTFDNLSFIPEAGVNNYVNRISKAILALRNLLNEQGATNLNKYQELVNLEDTYTENLLAIIKDKKLSDISVDELNTLAASIEEKKPVIKEFTYGLMGFRQKDHQYNQFAIPTSAIAFRETSPEIIQRKADAINAFTKEYGISPIDIVSGYARLSMDTKKKAQMQKEMQYLKTRTVEDFVCKKLEMILGDDFSVQFVTEKSNSFKDTLFDINDMLYSVQSTFSMNILEQKLQAEQDIYKRSLLVDNAWKVYVQTYIALSQKAASLNRMLPDDRKIKSSKLTDFKQLVNKNLTSSEKLSFMLSNRDNIESWIDAISSTVNKETTLYMTGNLLPTKHLEIIQKMTPSMLLDDKFSSGNIMQDSKNLSSMFNTNGWESDKVPLVSFLRDDTIIDYAKLLPYTVELKFTPDGSHLSKREKNIVLAITDAPATRINILTHEINHVIQDTNALAPGGVKLYNREYLHYIYTNFKTAIAFMLPDFDTSKSLTIKDIDNLSSVQKDRLAYIGYRLLEGELNAEVRKGIPMTRGARLENTTRIDDYTGKRFRYLQTPDGKIIRIYERDTEPHKYAKPVTVTPNETYITNGVNNTFTNIIDAYSEANRIGYTRSSKTRNTAHSALSRGNTFDLVSEIMSPEIDAITGSMATIDDIIRDPQTYLSQEMLDKIGKDLSEGNVYFRLREYFENQGKGISIDRNQLQDYIFVDDTSFDDILKPDMRKRSESDNVDIYNAYHGREIPLMTFYNTMSLAKYGLLSVKVIIDDSVRNESVFNSTRPDGLIRIHATDKTTDAQIIDRINHEFRHVLQKKNMLETGFTPLFRVTNEMLVDLKKHAADIFTNKQAIEYAKLNGAKTQQDIDTFIAQRFIYFLTGGEQNAFAWQSNLLNTKPVYVKYEGGRPTIFMPWYDGTEGRYKTEFLAMREAEDITATQSDKKTIALPTIDKKKEKAQLPRRISKKIAEGNNLQYFYDRAKKKGEQPQMDPDMQQFIIATTGNEDRLPSSLVHAIKNGTLGQQTFFKWFRQVKASDINQYTFNLINEYIFKNTVIDSMEDLDTILGRDAEFYWAAAIVLRREGLSAEALINENDIDHFMNVINSLEGADLKKKIDKAGVRFGEMTIPDSKGQLRKVQLNTDVESRNYMRVLAMKYFDGSLAGAFYLGNTYRKVLALEALEQEKGKDSLDRTITADKDMSVADKLSAGDVRDMGDTKNVANDILALYNLERGEDTNYMLETLAKAKYDIEVEKYIRNIKNEKARRQVKEWFYGDIELRDKIIALEKKLNKTDKETKLLKMMDVVNRQATTILDAVQEFQTKLSNMPHEILVDRFNRYMASRMTGTAVESSVMSPVLEGRKNVYANTVANIKSYGKKISNLLNNAQIAFVDLPAEVQAFFEEKTETTESGKTVKVYALKDTTYKVGRGRAALSEITSESHGKQYAHKRNLLDERQTYKHDTTRIEKNAQLLKDTYTTIQQIRKDRRMNVSREIRAVERANARADRNIKDILNARTEARATEKKLRETEFSVKKRKRTNDTPNHFTLLTGVEIPPVMIKIYDTSFNDLANTAVQFASRDTNGKLFDREKMSREEFDSRLQHEVSNWDAFYEANRDILLNLTREDVLDILDYYRNGGVIMTLDGPVNKLVAVEVFTLGYLVDAMRNNMNTWNFSAEDIVAVESLYEKKASAHGSGLNAVSQMKKIVRPFKKIEQHMLEEFNITDDQMAPFIEAMTTLQETTDPNEYKERVRNALAEIEKIEQQIILNDNNADKELRFRNKGFGKRWFEKLQSFRYTAMLSSPATWIRNTVSNAVLYSFNNVSDKLGNLLLSKKNYREDQWDLAHVQVSDEVKQFFDNYVKEQVKKDGLLDKLYDDASKYDERYRRSIKNGDVSFKVKDDIFVTLITNAIEQKFAAGHRFDSVVMNRWSSFVQKMISDKTFIRKVTNKYFNKILTLESQAGNVDLTKGLSKDVLNLFAESVILAQAEYMHKPSVIGDMLASLANKHEFTYNAIKLWQPFLNSSFNWFQEMLKYTGIGLARSIYKMSTLEKQIQKVEERRASGKLVTDSRATEYFIRRDIGKGMLGLLFTGLGLLLGTFGIIRIDDEDDELYLYATGNVKISISDIFGTSSILIGVYIAQLWLSNDENKWGDTAVRVCERLFEGFFLKDFLDRHQYDNSTYEAILTETESFLSSFVPQVIQLIVRSSNNKKIKYSKGMKGMFERWLNRFIPTQPLGQIVTDVYTGEPKSKYTIPVIGELMKSGLLGVKIFWSEISEQEEFSRTYGVNRQELTGEITVNGKKQMLNKNTLNEKFGELNKETILSLQTQYHKVKMPDGTYKTLPWDKLTEQQKTSVIERKFNENASIAKIYVWTQEMGNKYYASDEMWQELRAAGITKNVYKGDKGFVE